MGDEILENSDEENDLFYHALNYRGASSEHAELFWKELQACVNRMIEDAKEQQMTEIEERNRQLAEANRTLLLKIAAMRSAGAVMLDRLERNEPNDADQSAINKWKEAAK